jgi:hypothetical protein
VETDITKAAAAEADVLEAVADTGFKVVQVAQVVYHC